MAANSENLEGSRESPATSPSNPADNVESSEAKANSGETEVVSPEPTQPEPSEAFLRLKAHCESQGLKGDIDLVEPFENVSIEFKNGRNIRTVYIMSEEDARALLDHPLGDFVFLGGLSAICSYKGGWIEAAIRAHGTGPASRVGLRGIFGIANREDEPSELLIPGGNGMTLRLTEKPGALSLLGYNARLYLRIEGIGITEHDRALNLLEDLSNTLFMQIDFRFDSALTVGRDRTLSRRSARSRGRFDEDSQLGFPRFSYERNPSALYWYARSATAMPLLQFLAFYQCIEFFFPQYSRQETIAKIKNILKDPTFDGSKDSYVKLILNTTLEGRRGTLPEERKQLGATLKQCIDTTLLRDFLNETEERKRYFGSDYKKVSEKRISLADEPSVVDQTAERIYDIRCKVVHTKSFDSGEGEEMILPFSREAELLMEDVELIKFLARKVLIASSIPLKL